MGTTTSHESSGRRKAKASDSNTGFDCALRAITQTLAAGQRLLFVLGAGASVGAKVPLMREVYKHLATLCDEALDVETSKQSGDKQSNGDCLPRLRELKADLIHLTTDDAPRSVAARVLGTLQTAGKEGRQHQYDRLCAHIWAQFSDAFLKGKIPTAALATAVNGAEIPSGRFFSVCGNDALRREIGGTRWLQERLQDGEARVEGPLALRTPTVFHHCAAALASLGRAYIVSLNFDGLSRRAIEKVPEPHSRGQTLHAVVVSDDDGVENFWRGAQPHSDAVVPVFKIWGDVFHTVCINPRCPEYDKRTPLFAFREEKPELTCPECGAARQLEIYFAGYEEKEIRSEAMLRSLLSHLAPEVGCVIAVGVSGLWDKALGDFLCDICSTIEKYDMFSREPGSRVPSCICVDPKPSFLVDALRRRNIRVEHVSCTADDFAMLFHSDGVASASEDSTQPSDRVANLLVDTLWEKALHRNPTRRPFEHLDGRAAATYVFLCEKDGHEYLHRLKHLQQLGIKTRICARDADTVGNHNRHFHSLGATTLAAMWLDALRERKAIPPEQSRVGLPLDVVSSIVLLAVRHHDIGHLPFTHLMEEMFGEVHWIARDWGRPFKHDEPVLFDTESGIETEVGGLFLDDRMRDLRDACAPFAGMTDSDKARYVRHLAEAYCQGRSGRPWIDAIVNSPLDVDKLDYVFRDCHHLGQGLHIKNTGEDAVAWVRALICGCEVLPSGLMALAGQAGERARDFLEERIWLYRHTYFKPAFRALERVVRHAATQWLLRRVTSALSQKYMTGDAAFSVLKDTRSLKGKCAREVLWALACRQSYGVEESRVLDTMIEETLNEQMSGVPLDSSMREWLAQARSVFAVAFPIDRIGGALGGDIDQILHSVVSKCGIAISDRMYVNYRDLDATHEAVRQLEQEQPCGVLFDIAVLPRALSYPSAKRFDFMKRESVGECFAVPDRDPDKWHRTTNHWIPLSESAFARWDERRWGAVMAVALEGRGDRVRQGMDRLRFVLRTRGISFDETEPRVLM